MTLVFLEKEAHSGPIWALKCVSIVCEALISLRALYFELGDRQLTWAGPHATLEASSSCRMLTGGSVTSGSYMAPHLAGT